MAFFFVMFLEKIYFSNILTAVIFSVIWVPQIYRNSVKGYRNTPTLNYALAMSLHILTIPIYIRGYDGNFLFLKPNYCISTPIIISIMLQLLFLKVQQRFPRFLVPRSLQEAMAEGYYRYEQDFEEDAAGSSYSLLSNPPASRQPVDYLCEESLNAKVERTF